MLFLENVTLFCSLKCKSKFFIKMAPLQTSGQYGYRRKEQFLSHVQRKPGVQSLAL